jgi:hypothetical protein
MMPESSIAHYRITCKLGEGCKGHVPRRSDQMVAYPRGSSRDALTEATPA